MLKNLRVRSKLFFSYCAILVFYIIAIVSSYYGMRSIFRELEKFYQIPYPMVESALTAQSATRQIRADVYRASIAETDADMQAIFAEIEQEATVLADALATLSDTYDGDPALLQEVTSAVEQTRSVRLQAMEYIKNHDDAAVQNLMNGDYASIAANMDGVIQKIIDVAEEQATAYHDAGTQTRKAYLIAQLIMAIVSIVLTFVIAIKIIRNLTYPIIEMESVVKEMAKGNMKSHVTYQSKDELGSLAENLRFVLKTLSEYISHICARMDSLAEGDLTVDMDMEYLGEFSSIRHSGNKIIESLNDALGQIEEASSQVANGSEQVSSGAQALSQGATEQASSVEELVATISELSEQVNQTAQNSRDVNNLITETAGEVDNSNRMMEALMGAMTKINNCSSEIRKIIKTIEDIAFQTNILALNAAVEAARAGEAGKGFAVVADEVRSLASKSAEAAKETTALIGNSLTAVSEGNSIAADTQSSLLKVVQNAQKISSNMALITEASDRQAEGIQQVTLGIDQISSVVQTNSATAEQSAAASEELSSQANLLKNLVGHFRLKGVAMPMIGQSQPSQDETGIGIVEEYAPDLASANDYVPVSAPDSSYVPVPEPTRKRNPLPPTVPFVDNKDKY